MIIDRFKKITIFQFGVGGTGSWLIPSMVKFLRNMKLRFNNEQLTIKYVMIDDDIVEQRNTLRQNFEDYDVGRKKVTALARKFMPTFNDITYYDKRPSTRGQMKKIFDDKVQGVSHITPDSIVFVFGCVDDNKPRRVLFNMLEKVDIIRNGQQIPVIYFDSGNNLHNGQIVTSTFNLGRLYQSQIDNEVDPDRDVDPEEKEYNSFKNENRFENPEFLKMFPSKVDPDEENQSCAFFGDQSQTINTLAAGLLFAHFQKAIINDLIPPPVVQFNSSGMSTFQL